MSQVMIVLGSLGVLGMTWLFPVCARALLFARGERSNQKSKVIELSSLAIIIPAKNESATIGQTLEKIKEAIRRAESQNKAIKFSIILGDDGSSDETAQQARRHGATVLRSESALGKWKTLERLLGACCDADCIALVDSGALWPESLLVDAITEFSDPAVAVVAPSYANSKGGFAERLLWSFERHLKGLEQASGGPLSTHGATVFYRAEILCDVFAHLNSSTEWLNDDIALPLTVRARYPGYRIAYLDNCIVDECAHSQSEENSQLGRRLRMVSGNLQWIKRLLPPLFRTDFIVGLLALRRVSRVFWAYWALLLLIGVLTLVVQSPVAVIGILLSLATLSLFTVWLRLPGFELIEAALASLAAPYLALERRELVRRWR